MEKLERKALQTAPAECRPKIWKRYVDDVLNVIKKDQVKNFTDHLNSIDDINSIKFTYEEETNGVIPFLDLLINRQPDKHHRSRHVRLYQSAKFYPNRTTLGRKNDVMSIFKMAYLSHLGL